MRKRKRQLNPLYDWAQIPTGVPKITSGYKPDYRADFKREEEEALLAPFKKAEAELHAETRAIRKRVAAFFSLPLAEMSNYSMQAVPLDYIAYPQRSGDRDLAAERETLLEFWENLSEKHCELSQDGWERYRRFLGVLVVKGNVDATKLETLETALARCVELEIFHSGELTGYQLPAKPATVEPPAKLDTENLASTDERWRKIVNAGFSQEAQEMYRAWSEQMARDWKVDVLTQEMATKFGQFCDHFNKSPRNPKSFDEFRRFAHRNGWLGEGDFRTPQERLSDSIEAAADINSYETRRAINRMHRNIVENNLP